MNRHAYCLMWIMLVATSGCHRSWYRLDADAEAYQLIAQKATDPRWPLERFTIEVDPASRMFDPFNPDHPPIPKDDPTSHRLMHCVDCKPGYPCWHCNGDTNLRENPHWLDLLPVNEAGKVVINEESAVHLALLHSPSYQSSLEDLYLSALDVSFERFRFDAQFFGGYETEYTADGSLRTGAGDAQSVFGLNTFPGTRGIRMQKMCATGSELVVGLANSLVWQFSGPDTHTATTLLDFTLVQPLLRRGGRARVLERLTIAERALLANVRQMERYRRGFYLQVVTGNEAGNGPSRRGGVFGGAGLEGFSGVGGGGFGRVGGGGGGGGGFGSGSGAGVAGGYFGLLQLRQEITNQRYNLKGLENSLRQLENTLQASKQTVGRTVEEQESHKAKIVRDRLQVAQAKQAVLNARSRLLNTENSYINTEQRFKMQLGLPPHLPLEIDEGPIKRFNLLDERVLDYQAEIDKVASIVGGVTGCIKAKETQVDIVGQLNCNDDNAVVDVDPATTVSVKHLEWDQSVVDELQRLITVLREVAETLDEFQQTEIQRGLREVDALLQADSVRMPEAGPLPEPQDIESLFCPRAIAVWILVNDDDRIKNTPQGIRSDLERLRQEMQVHRDLVVEVAAGIEMLASPDLNVTPEQWNCQYRKLVLFDPAQAIRYVSSNILELLLLKARSRTLQIELSDVAITDEEKALEVARESRRDWMNARASLVDAWRLIEFNANDLESTLDVVFSGDVGNVGDNPFRLDEANGRLRVGLQFDAPITRLSERNVYRQALIEFQQARRSYYRFADSVRASLSNTIRTLNVNRTNFELRRQAILMAIRQIEINDAIERELQEQSSNVTAARDTVSALQDLQTAQSDFLSVWINYEVLRRQLEFDLGTMKLRPDGVWLDPGSKAAEELSARAPDNADPDLGTTVPAQGEPDKARGEPTPALREPKAALRQPARALREPGPAMGDPADVLADPGPALEEPVTDAGEPLPVLDGFLPRK